MWMSRWIIRLVEILMGSKDLELARWKNLRGEKNWWNLLAIFVICYIRFLKVELLLYFCSQATFTCVFDPSGPQCLPKAKKRKRTCQRRQYVSQVDATFMSARTRPLLNYHKPRLFLMDPLSHREQVGIYLATFHWSESVFLDNRPWMGLVSLRSTKKSY